MRIGVFDSGIGGKAVATELGKLLPNAEIISVDDHDHVPYGDRPPEEIIELTKIAIKPLLSSSCDAIIIACNTATTVAISNLRTTYPDVNFIGIEPMVKPAAKLTRSGVIAVLATPRTLQSDRYNELKQTWAKDIVVIEPDCKNWSKLIEENESDQIDIETVTASLISQKVDVIVLGCTHYHHIKQRIVDSAGPDISVLEPTDAIANRVKSLIG